MGSFPSIGTVDQATRTALLRINGRLAAIEAAGGDPAMGGDLTGVASAAQIAAGAIVNADVNAAAAIADTKLATISTANKVALSALDIDGATDIGADLADGDLIVVDDGAGGTNRKSVLSRLATYIFAKVSSHITMTAAGVATIANAVITKAMLATSSGELGGAWTTYTPTLTNVTGGTCVAAYRQVGKMLTFRIAFSAGTATALGSISATFGVATNSIATYSQACTAYNGNVATSARVPGGSQTVAVYGSTAGAAWAAGASVAGVYIAGTVELA